MISPGDFAGLAAVAVAGISVLTLVSAVARRIAGPRRGPDMVFGMHAGASSRTVDEMRDEIDQLRSELSDVQSRLRQVDELQERLDFTERVIAQGREKGALPGGNA